MFHTPYLKTAFAGLAVAATLVALPATAETQLLNWQLDLPGAQPVINGITDLSIDGHSYINTNLGGGNPGPNFTFTDTGIFNFSGSLFGPGNPQQITAHYYNGTGNGDLASGQLTFTNTGRLDIYYYDGVDDNNAGDSAGVDYAWGTSTGAGAPLRGANSGILIASFAQLATPFGESAGSVNPDATPSSNGPLTLEFEATYLATGVWLDSAGNALPLGTTLGFVTTNASVNNGNCGPGTPPGCVPNADTQDIVSALGGNSPNAQPGEFLVRNGGQFKLAQADVPEPGTLALLGLGLLGLTFTRRARS